MFKEFLKQVLIFTIDFFAKSFISRVNARFV